MLSDHEKRQLRLIEQEFERDAPGFACEMRNARAGPQVLDRVWPYVSTVLSGMALFILGCMVGSVLLLLSGGFFVALALVMRAGRRRGLRQPPRP